MSKFLKKLDYSYLIVVELIFLFFILSLGFSIFLIISEFPDLRSNGHEFSILADSFLHGETYLWKYPFNDLDCVMFGGRCYWELGPFPAIILIPLVFLSNIIGIIFYQGYLQFFISIGVFILAWALAQKFRYSFSDSLWLAFAFCFASVYLGIAFNSQSWYFAQAITVLILFLSLFEYFNKKRYWLIGLYFAFIFATRFTAGFGILFFVLDIFLEKKLNFKDKFKQLLLMFIPLVVGGILLSYYNLVRFGSIFDNGYNKAAIGADFLRQIRSQNGLFNIKYFFSNLYYYFIKIPDPILQNNYLLIPPYFKVSPWGLSFFVVSPIFIKIFWAKIKNRVVALSWWTSLVVLFFLLIFYNTGYWQLGPRYILDLLPFWFLILLFSFKNHKLALRHQVIISLSAFVNLFLFINLYSQ